MKKTLLTLMLFYSFMIYAQWECPSRLGGNLKPIKGLPENLTWALELIGSAGYAGEYGIANATGFYGIDYSTEKFSFYLEGGAKSWIRYGADSYYNNGFSLGFREGYMQYRGNNNTLNLGLRSTKGKDHYLLNERMIGLDYEQKAGNFSMNLLTGTVMKDFARNGTFCTLGYLYNIVPGRERSVIGRNFGETNLALLSLEYKPGKSSASDEFSSDEFSSNENAVKSIFKLNNIGALLYHEYGSLIQNKALFSGIYAEAEFAGITVKPEAILQSSTSNRMLIWNLTIEKQILWSESQNTKLYGRYIGTIAIDSGAKVLNSFSNIFAGEVLRMDALELPVLQIGLKHSFAAIKSSLKLQAALQTGKTGGYVYNPWGEAPVVDRMLEYDLVFTKNFGDHILLNAHAGYLVYPDMVSPFNYETKHTPWGKVEIRYTF